MRVCYVAVMVVGCMAIAWRLLLRALFEFSGPFSHDSLVFAAVGRGILNGLTLYHDLLEVKPPGIFVLSALSLWLTNSFALIHILNMCIVFAIPLTVVWASLQHERRRRAWGSLPLALAAFIAGGLFSFYAFSISGGYQVETFAMLGGLLYVTAIDHPEGAFSWWRVGLAGLGMFIAVVFKEPFFFALVASALFLAPHPRTLVRTLVFPALVAGAAYILLLVPLGAMHSYVYEYLLPMIQSKASQSIPVWQRGLRPDPLALEWWSFAPAMAVFFCALPLLHLIRRVWTRSVQGRWWRIAAALLGCYFLIFSAWTVGEFPTGRHLLYTVPGLFALVLSLLDEHTETSLRTWIGLGVSAILFLCAVTVPLYTYGEYRAQTASIHEQAIHGQQTAAQIDGILDACNIDRYAYIGGHTAMNPYGFSQHSPLGPLFFQAPVTFHTFPRAVRLAFIQNIGTARLIVLRQFTYIGDPGFVPAAFSYLQTHFSTEPWPCAAQFGLPADPSLVFLFRTSSEPFNYPW